MKIAQCRMARAALDWTMDDLAEASGVGRRTIVKFEKGGNVLPETVETLRAALVKAGIGFTNGGRRAGVTYALGD